jgi:hypothetical protein
MNNRETSSPDICNPEKSESKKRQRQTTSATDASFRLPAADKAFDAATEAASGLRIFPPSAAGRNDKGPGITEAFEAFR